MDALSDEFLDMVRRGAAPVPLPEQKRYFTMIASWLDECPLLTPRALADAIRQVQSELLRPARMV
jgi:hypothetical protein